MYVKRIVCLGLFVLWSSILHAQVAIKVVDETGGPVSKFEAMYHTADEGWSQWQSGTRGEGALSLLRPKSRVINVLVRSDEFVPATITYEGEKLQELLRGEATIALAKGSEVELQLLLPEGMTFPEGFVPLLYFPDYEATVRMMWQLENLKHGEPDFNMLNAKPIGDGRYRFRLSDEPLKFRVAIHHPGWLRFCDLGQFSVDNFEDNRLELDVPQPAGVEAKLNRGGTDDAELPFEDVAFQLYWRIPGTNQSLLSVDSAMQLASTSFEVDDLGPGLYRLQVATQPIDSSEEINNRDVHPGRFREVRNITLEPNQKKQVTFDYVPFDSLAFRGDGTARIQVLSADEELVTNRPIKVSFFDGHYGMLTAYEGSIPDDGSTVIKGLSTQLTSYDSPYGPYTVEVDGERLGYFRFEADQSEVDVELRIIPQPGDQAPDIELTRIESNEVSRLRALQGKIVLLELWATWCGPCQPAMDKLNEIVLAHRENWNDQVVVVPLSVDETSDRLRRHIEQRGWTGLEHYWSARGKSEPISSAELVFVVHGIPTAILIDREGRIAWRGHPMDETDGYDLSGRIDRLMAGKGLGSVWNVRARNILIAIIVVGAVAYWHSTRQRRIHTAPIQHDVDENPPEGT